MKQKATELLRKVQELKKEESDEDKMIEDFSIGELSRNTSMQEISASTADLSRPLVLSREEEGIGSRSFSNFDLSVGPSVPEQETRRMIIPDHGAKLEGALEQDTRRVIIPDHGGQRDQNLRRSSTDSTHQSSLLDDSMMESGNSLHDLDEDEDEDMEDPESEQEEIDTQQFTYDPCYLTHKWKEVTNDHRAHRLKLMLEESELTFGERRAVCNSDELMDAFIFNQSWFQERGRLRREVGLGKKDPSLLTGAAFSHFFLPELYPCGVPLSWSEAEPFHSELLDFYSYEDTSL